MSARRAFFASLQWRLIASFAGLTVVALLAAGAIFVYLSRGDEEDHELSQVASKAPVVGAEFVVRQFQGESEQDLKAFVNDAATRYGVRIILTDEAQLVIADSEHSLEGQELQVQPEPVTTHRGPLEPYAVLRPPEGTPGSSLLLVAPTLRGPRGLMMGERERAPVVGAARAPSTSAGYSLYIGVPRQTITRAWLGLLPALGIASAVALPLAVALAVALARYITRPLEQLTVATNRMAAGTFDVNIAVKRHDEVGQLAQAFTDMAGRVGQAHMDMRALVANVSHDLKTPLTSILGFAQALRSGPASPEEGQRMGEVIHEEATRLAARLEDLLYISELDSGRAVLDRDEIEVARLVNQGLGRVEADLRARGVTVQRDLAPGLTVSADGPKLERALENLLENARKFTPDHGSLRVATRSEPGRVCLDVANTNPGIEPAELTHLFERFYRSDRARSGRGNGTGLGLSIARDIVALHGGTLDAALAGGEIVFRVRLPAS